MSDTVSPRLGHRHARADRTMRRGEARRTKRQGSYSQGEGGLTLSLLRLQALLARPSRFHERVANAVIFKTCYCTPSDSNPLGNGGGVPVSGTYAPAPGTHRSNRPWTQGTSPGAFGPHARAVTAISWDRRPRTTFLGTFALQPVGPRKAQKNHSKTLNIDLSLPDRPRLAVVSFQPYSHGAVRAAATLDEALSSNLNPVGRRWIQR